MMERFSWLAGGNFTKLEMNVVKLSLQYNFVFRILKSFSVSAQRPPTDGPLPKKWSKWFLRYDTIVGI